MPWLGFQLRPPKRYSGVLPLYNRRPEVKSHMWPFPFPDERSKFLRKLKSATIFTFTRFFLYFRFLPKSNAILAKEFGAFLCLYQFNTVYIFFLNNLLVSYYLYSCQNLVSRRFFETSEHISSTWGVSQKQ